LRHKHEQEHLQHWLAVCHEAAVDDYAVAVELLRSRRLVKGYSDTHARSLSKFDKVLLGARLVQGRQDAAKWVARLREAALQDEQGEALDGAIQTLKSFTDVPVDVASGA
jgi:indolepyruvate ferredoxin oxidoreductase beta subunit